MSDCTNKILDEHDGILVTYKGKPVLAKFTKELDNDDLKMVNEAVKIIDKNK